mgnify:FL=1|tara:strand:+ start:239 stop:481 length:243 start_codon:yes stop_codon:yes gene_type:complete
MNAYIKSNNLGDGSFSFDVVVSGNYEFLDIVRHKNKHLDDWSELDSDFNLIYYPSDHKTALEILENAKQSAKIMVDRWGS